MRHHDDTTNPKPIIPRRDNGALYPGYAESVMLELAPNTSKAFSIGQVVMVNGRAGLVDRIDTNIGEIRVVLEPEVAK